jgi:uncharacterized protein YecT (DUF1311 family)
MSIDPIEGAAPAPTHRGFSAPPPLTESQPRGRGPIDGRTLLVGGVAAAVLLGVGLGIWARPKLAPAPVRAPMQAVTPPGEGHVQILVNPVKPMPPPKPGSPLQVLPADMAAAAPRPPEPPAAVADSAFAEAPANLGPAPVAQVPRTARPSFDCAGSLSPAQEMVCADPRLAAADRRMAQAYSRAIQAGVPPEDLRAEQRDWRAIREDAAEESPRAVAQVYDQRIRDLEDMAAEPSPEAER